MWKIFFITFLVFSIIKSSQPWTIEECQQLFPSSPQMKGACSCAHHIVREYNLDIETVNELMFNIEHNKLEIEFPDPKIRLPYHTFVHLADRYFQNVRAVTIVSPPSDFFLLSDYRRVVYHPNFQCLERLPIDDRNVLLSNLLFDDDFKNVEVLVPGLLKGNFQTISPIIDNHLLELRNLSVVKTKTGRLVDYSIAKRIQNIRHIVLSPFRENSSSIESIALLDGSRISISQLKNIIDDLRHPKNVEVLNRVRLNDKQEILYGLSPMSLWLKVFLAIRPQNNGNFSEDDRSMLHLTNDDRESSSQTSTKKMMQNIDHSREYVTNTRADTSHNGEDSDSKTVKTLYKLVPNTNMEIKKNTVKEFASFDAIINNNIAAAFNLYDTQIISSVRTGTFNSGDKRREDTNNSKAGRSDGENLGQTVAIFPNKTIPSAGSTLGTETTPPYSKADIVASKRNISESSTSFAVNIQTSSYTTEKTSASIQNKENVTTNANNDSTSFAIRRSHTTEMNNDWRSNDERNDSILQYLNVANQNTNLDSTTWGVRINSTSPTILIFNNDNTSTTQTVTTETNAETVSVSPLFVTNNNDLPNFEIVSATYSYIHSDNRSNTSFINDVERILLDGKSNEISSSTNCNSQTQNFSANTTRSKILCPTSPFFANENNTKPCLILGHVRHLPYLSRPIHQNSTINIDHVTENERHNYTSTYDWMPTKNHDKSERKLDNSFVKPEQNQTSNINISTLIFNQRYESEISSTYAPKPTADVKRTSKVRKTDSFLGSTRRPFFIIPSNYVGIPKSNNFRTRSTTSSFDRDHSIITDVSYQKQRPRTRNFNNKILRKFSKSKTNRLGILLDHPE